jgi:hypothetical protein
MFSKDNYDISNIFIAYLTFLGNCTKVSIALDIQAEVVEVLAAKEDWPSKLKTYTSLRHEDKLSTTERKINRTGSHIQACHLRELILRLLEHIHQRTDDESLIEWFSTRNPKTNRSEFNSRTLLDLTRALFIASRIIARTRPDKEPPPDAEEESAKERQTLREALARTMSGIDRLPGLDSVALAKHGLAKWDSKGDEPQKDKQTV